MAVPWAAVNGDGNPQSVFGQVGQTYGGEHGRLTGEVANAGLAGALVGTGINRNARLLNLGLVFSQFAITVVCE